MPSHASGPATDKGACGSLSFHSNVFAFFYVLNFNLFEISRKFHPVHGDF